MNGQLPQLHICSIKMLYRILSKQPNAAGVAAILCSDSAIREDRLLGIHYIFEQFADITGQGRNAFDRKIAASIADFVNTLTDGITDLYVCCDAGESRSAAIAAAIMRHWEMDDMVIWKNPQYHPNTLVYRYQMLAFGLTVTERQCIRLKRISEAALSAAIQHTKTER